MARNELAEAFVEDMTIGEFNSTVWTDRLRGHKLTVGDATARSQLTIRFEMKR